MNNKNKERLAEMKFKEWLDCNNIPYWYIQQNIETFSIALKKYMSKRPDFFILVPNIGFILTDVEYKQPLEKYEKFAIDLEESKKYSNLQKYFNLQVWYVFSSEKYHFTTWFWIPVSRVLEIGVIFKSKDKRENYVTIPLKEFIQLSKNDNLGRLFSEIPKML